MSWQSQTTTRRDAEKPPVMDRIKVIGGILACGAVALCLIATVAATAILLLGSRTSGPVRGAWSLPGPTQTPRAGTIQPTCDEPGEPACAGAITWIPLKSQSPADILAATRQSTLFNLNCPAGGDCISDLSHLGAPVLVHGLSAPGGPVEPDFYVIPINDGTGATAAAAEAELNPAHTAITVMAIVSYGSPYLHDAIVRMSASAAIADVAAQHHTTLRANAQPWLVYIVFDYSAVRTGKVVWNDGGGSPARPIWLIPGADGKDHIVGADGHVYYMSEIPDYYGG